MFGRWFAPHVFLVFATIGCATFPSKELSQRPSILRGSNLEIQEELLKRIPIGTSHDDAKRLIQSLGLELTPKSGLGLEPQDVIACQYTGRKGLFGQATWLIEIDCPDGKVADIICEQIFMSF
jgi:hypothetical protein